MLPGNLCELCKGKVQAAKARHKQTRYCVECAKAKKRENSLDARTPEEKRDYMRKYMRVYRAQARLGCLALLLPFLGGGGLSLESLNFGFEDITTGIVYAELLVIKLTGLATVVVLCIKHLKHSWKDKGGDKEK
jgi:hypothetical protein